MTTLTKFADTEPPAIRQDTSAKTISGSPEHTLRIFDLPARCAWYDAGRKVFKADGAHSPRANDRFSFSTRRGNCGFFADRRGRAGSSSRRTVDPARIEIHQAQAALDFLSLFVIQSELHVVLGAVAKVVGFQGWRSLRALTQP